MNEWIDKSIAQYYQWLKDQTTYRLDENSGWCRVSTPFMGMFNDPIEVFIKHTGENILLSDDGVTIENLELSGVDIFRSPKRREWMEYIRLNFGIDVHENELRTEANMSNFAQKKHNLICAIAELSGLEITAKNTIQSMFKEDVRSLLDEQDLIYTPHFIAKGSTGIDFTFDFQIAGKKNETVIKTFNVLNKTNVPNFLFGWDDVKSAREKVSGKALNGLAIINDTDRDIKGDLLSALKSKGADYILWSERNKPTNIRKLSAVG